MENTTPENLQQNAVPEWTAEKTTELFNQFNLTLVKDREDFGNHPRWRAYYEECAQRFKDYAKVTPNGETPTTPEGMKAMNDALNAVDAAIKNYTIDRALGEKIPKEPTEQTKRIKKNTEKADMPENFEWRAATHDIFGKYTKVKDAAESLKLTDSPQYKEYKTKAGHYLDVYVKYAEPAVTDEKMVQTTVWEMKNLMNAYFPADEYTPEVLNDPEKLAKKLKSAFPPKVDADKAISFLGLTVNAATAENKVIDSQFISIDKSPTKEVDIRERVIRLAAMKEYATLDDKQLEAVLFMKAHMKDIGGEPTPGENVTYFNRDDAFTVSSAVRDDLFTRKADLYKQILEKAEASTDPKDKLTENDTFGLRIMLGIASVEDQNKFQAQMRRLAAAPGQIADGERKLAKGYRLVSLPIIRRLPLPRIRGKIAAGEVKLRNGKAEYFAGLRDKTKFDETLRNLPETVRQGIELKIQEGMDQGNIAPVNAVDTTPRPNVDENLMNQYAAQAKNMLSIGEGGLDRIMLRSNTFIQGVATAGPNEATLNALLASQNGPRGLHGIPPGTVLHLRPLTDEERVALVEKLQIRDESKVAVGNE